MYRELSSRRFRGFKGKSECYYTARRLNRTADARKVRLPHVGKFWCVRLGKSDVASFRLFWLIVMK